MGVVCGVCGVCLFAHATSANMVGKQLTHCFTLLSRGPRTVSVIHKPQNKALHSYLPHCVCHTPHCVCHTQAPEQGSTHSYLPNSIRSHMHICMFVHKHTYVHVNVRDVGKCRPTPPSTRIHPKPCMAAKWRVENISQKACRCDCHHCCITPS